MAAKRKAVEVEWEGVKASAYPDAMDDYELYEIGAEHGTGSSKFVVAALRALFGPDGLEGVKEQLRDETGRVPLSAMVEFYKAAQGQVDAAKN